MELYLPLLSGLVGAIIGAGVAIVTVIVQTRAQSRSNRIKEAISLAVEDWKFRTELSKQRGGKILPLSIFIHYHSRMVELAENGKLTAESIKAINKEQESLISAIEELSESWRK